MHKAPRFAPVVVILLLMAIFIAFLVSRASGENGAITTTGTIEIDEVIVAPEAAGRVREVLVAEGDRVVEGQVLVQFDTATLQAQRAQLEAALRAAQANARAAQASLDLISAGPSPEQLAVAQAGVDQAELALDIAQETYDDLAEYLRETSTGIALNQQVERAQAALNAAQAQYNLVATGARPEQVQAAREQAEAAVAQADAAQAALDLLDVQLNKMSLISPINGMVLERIIQPGEFAAPGSVLLVLGKEESMTLTVYVPEDRYGEISLGQTVEVRVDSFPGETFEGRVVHIADQAEFTPRNVQTVSSRKSTVFGIRLALAGGQDRLKAGMPADVVFK